MSSHSFPTGAATNVQPFHRMSSHSFHTGAVTNVQALLSTTARTLSGARGQWQAAPESQSRKKKEGKKKKKRREQRRQRTKGAPNKPRRRRATRAQRAQHRGGSLVQKKSPSATKCHGPAQCALAVGNPASTPHAWPFTQVLQRMSSPSFHPGAVTNVQPFLSHRCCSECPTIPYTQVLQRRSSHSFHTGPATNVQPDDWNP